VTTGCVLLQQVTVFNHMNVSVKPFDTHTHTHHGIARVQVPDMLTYSVLIICRPASLWLHCRVGLWACSSVLCPLNVF
jgi:hypothetical protein